MQSFCEYCFLGLSAGKSLTLRGVPLAVQPRHDVGEREPVPPLKGRFACAMVCARRLRVAVRTERHAGVVGRLLAHAAVRPSKEEAASSIFGWGGGSRAAAEVCMKFVQWYC